MGFISGISSFIIDHTLLAMIMSSYIVPTFGKYINQSIISVFTALSKFLGIHITNKDDKEKVLKIVHWIEIKNNDLASEKKKDIAMKAVLYLMPWLGAVSASKIIEEAVVSMNEGLKLVEEEMAK